MKSNSTNETCFRVCIEQGRVVNGTDLSRLFPRGKVMEELPHLIRYLCRQSLGNYEYDCVKTESPDFRVYDCLSKELWGIELTRLSRAETQLERTRRNGRSRTKRQFQSKLLDLMRSGDLMCDVKFIYNEQRLELLNRASRSVIESHAESLYDVVRHYAMRLRGEDKSIYHELFPKEPVPCFVENVSLSLKVSEPRLSPSTSFAVGQLNGSDVSKAIEEKEEKVELYRSNLRAFAKDKETDIQLVLLMYTLDHDELGSIENTNFTDLTDTVHHKGLFDSVVLHLDYDPNLVYFHTVG